MCYYLERHGIFTQRLERNWSDAREREAVLCLVPRSAGCGIDQISQCTGHQLDIIAEHDPEHFSVFRLVSHLQDMLAAHVATVGARGLEGTSTSNDRTHLQSCTIAPDTQTHESAVLSYVA